MTVDEAWAETASDYDVLPPRAQLAAKFAFYSGYLKCAQHVGMQGLAQEACSKLPSIISDIYRAERSAHP